MPQLEWARLIADVNTRLRRGAWYRVVKRGALEVVVDVTGVRTAVPRPFVEIVATPPRRWSVVRQPLDPLQPRPGFGEQYAVCPNCRERQPVDHRRSSLRCHRCNGLFDIEWS
ncbi:MAG TPA: hypothetical protein VM716_11035 [Gemmatimonadales bacterium]|nr:hypothetical protein [Gemmatimonadales bacterium]